MNNKPRSSEDEGQLIDEAILMPILEKEAELKNLKVFLYRDEELRKYYTNANPDVGIALLARDEDSAKFNIQNLRRCYLVKLQKDEYETCDAEVLVEEANIV